MRLQITVPDDLKVQMDQAKDFYGGYSALIREALREFLSRPVEPFPEDVRDSEEARRQDDWVPFDAVRKRLDE